MIDEKFLEEYTAALNKATDLMAKLQKKAILYDGIDDQLIHDSEQANAEVDRLSNQLLSMNKQ